MTRTATDFIRGTQIFWHHVQMFAAGFRGPLLGTAAAFLGLGWWQVTSSLTDRQAYLIWMKFYAELWAFMEFDPAKPVTLQSGFGGTFELAISRVPEFPPVAAAWGAFLNVVIDAAVLVTLIAMPLIAAFFWYSVRFGKNSKATKHQRGARLATSRELLAQIKAHNRVEQGKELRPLLGQGWRFARVKELDRIGLYRPFTLAGIPYPWREEQAHTMLIGSTGMGKTVAMMDQLDQIRARGHRAIVFDLTGAYISSYFDEERDTILHPLDARCPAWNIFDECRTAADFTNAAQALVPHDGGGAEQFWVLGARTLFVETCISLLREGETTNEALADALMRADLSELHERLKGTLAGPISDPESAKVAQSVRAVFNVNAQALLYLPSTGPRFSIRDWVNQDRRDGSILFVAARYVDLAICRQLLTLWLDIAVNTLMARKITNELRLWFLLDELGALHRLPALESGLQTARNFGGAFVTGVHTYSKLKETYGDNIAATLSSVTKTKLILGSSDPESAKWCSDLIGAGEVHAVNEGYSFGIDKTRDAVSLSPERREEALVLPDEVRKLAKLEGYVAFPGNLPAALVKFRPKTRVSVAASYIPRPGIDLERGDAKVPGPRPSSGPAAGGAAVASSSDDGEGGKAADPRQGQLALTHKQTDAVNGRGATKGSDASEPARLRDELGSSRRDQSHQATAGSAAQGRAADGSIDPIIGRGRIASPTPGDNAANLPSDAVAQTPPGSQTDRQSRTARRATSKAQAIQSELTDPATGQQRTSRDVGDFEIEP